MKRASSASVVAFVGMASLLPFRGAHGGVTSRVVEPGACTIKCVAHGVEIKISELPGAYIAVHFVPPDGAGRGAIASYGAAEPVLAGVQHVFVTSEGSEEFDGLAKAGTGTMSHFAVDTDGKVAREFKVAAGTATVVVLDRDRKELWREVGTSPMNAQAFSPRMRRAWVLPSIRDYNLPKDSTLAVQGYDVVAYSTESKAVKGQESLVSEFRGLTYRFATARNRASFVSVPERFIPAYGGWCASAIGAKAEKVEIDPRNFKVKDGRLFLFYKSLFADALKDWNQHEKEWEPAADANWTKIAGEEPIKPSRGLGK
ncbi:MAG: hypothetical protein IT438_04200 [Phycisphaerales bacterium]|nr:hypothetical protein [Phycisphaerales bacterium]